MGYTKLLFCTILSAVLITSSSAQIHQFFERGDSDSNCTDVDWDQNAIGRFTGIFFGDFYIGGNADILGPLAVKGNFHAPNYVVNANGGADCSNPSSFDSYGLVVGGITDTSNTQVHGSAYLAGGGTLNGVAELEQGCIVTDQQGTGLFDFAAVENLLRSASQKLAGFSPSLMLEDDDHVIPLRTMYNNFEILTFHTCLNTERCSSNRQTESSPDHLFYDVGNWNGVQGSVTPNPSKTYVLNIPVTNGATFEFKTNNPDLPVDVCKLIWNYYPVDSNGNYLPDGEFTLIRRVASQLGGFTLAPRGHIVDTTAGNFAGNLVGLSYSWESSNGVEIHNYKADGGTCLEYSGCITPARSESLTGRTGSRTYSTLSITDCVSIALDTMTSITSITRTTLIRTTTDVTVTKTSQDTSIIHSTIEGQTMTRTSTETSTRVTVETETDMEMTTTTTTKPDTTLTETSTVTAAIMSSYTITQCSDSTIIISSNCGTVEIMCSSLSSDCQHEQETHSENEHDCKNDIEWDGDYYEAEKKWIDDYF